MTDFSLPVNSEYNCQTPCLSSGLEKGVTGGTIKGAAITGASITLLSGHGVTLSAAAAASAAYLAITPGKGGDAARIIGSTVWTSANKAAELYNRYEINRRFIGLIGMMLKNQEQNVKEVGNLKREINALLSDVEETVVRAEKIEEDEESATVTVKAEKDVESLEKASNDEPEVERAFEEEATRIAEEAIIAKETSKSAEEDARLAEEELAEKEAARLAEEAREEELAAKRALEEEAVRLAEEEARLVEEEAVRLAEEEARMVEEQLAKEMDIAARAREAVEIFEAATEDVGGSDLEDLDFDEPTDIDLEDVSISSDLNEDFDEDFNLEAVARMAREAVDQYESSLNEEETVVKKDWSLITVVKLKEELKKRGLKATGRKADLVKTLEESDRELTNGEETRNKHPIAPTVSKNDTEIDASNDSDYQSLNLNSMTVAQLKEELRRRGLKVGGKKAELIDRLSSA